MLGCMLQARRPELPFNTVHPLLLVKYGVASFKCLHPHPYSARHGVPSQDVVKWLLMYFFCALAWAAGFYVLYRNQRAGIGPYYGDMQDECLNIQMKLGEHFFRTFLFLLQVTFDGGGYWDCAAQSSYQVRSA